jgi:hypothetical protein
MTRSVHFCQALCINRAGVRQGQRQTDWIFEIDGRMKDNETEEPSAECAVRQEKK